MPNGKNELKEYRARRDLEKSREPGGPGSGSPGSRLAFVIQKHAASRLHYDFRLEAGGVLKSWAVPKGMPADPDDKKLAVMVEDHPLDYAGFEGVIPEGNYGAGEVIVWDKGYYLVPGKRNAGEMERELLAGIEAGKLDFFLWGEKTRGGYHMVRMKDRKDWLLMKKDDEYARVPTLSERSVISGQSLEELKEGFRGALPELEGGEAKAMPAPFQPMFAQLVDEPFDDKDWIFELKYDGYRIMAFIDEGVRLYSRNRLLYNDRFKELVPRLRRIGKKAVLDGEVVVLDDRGRPDFQLLQEHIKDGRGAAVYFVFDVLYYDGYDLSRIPLIARKKILKRILPGTPDIRYVEHVEEQGKLFAREAKNLGVEGVIAKRMSSFYYPGTRSEEWLKIKNFRTQEAVIAGFTDPKGARPGLGALVLGLYEGEDLVYIGHAGGGFSDDQLKGLREKLEAYKTGECPFKEEPATNADVTWLRPELVCQVKFSNWTAEGLMRQPVFLELRDDKPAREAIREKEAPIGRIMAEEAARDAQEAKVTVTNPDKIYWPESHITKKDLVDYYERIAPVILPYLKDRPESLHRFPDGITGESFYQKNMVDAPKWVRVEKIFSESEFRFISYLLCQDRETLRYMANLGCIGLNPWSSRIGSLDYPDYMILDIDPLGVGFGEVVKVALITHEVLEGAGIRSFPKTSGATGIHICVPLKARYSYEQVKDFARLINMLVFRQMPGLTSLERDPRRRTERIYLDYLQNRKGQTLAAPYSVKPLPGAPVSAPLRWSEVGQSLDPKDFHMKNIFSRLEKEGDLWQGMLEGETDMLEAITRLEAMFKKL